MNTIIQQIVQELVENILKDMKQTNLDLNELSKTLLGDCKQAACHLVEAYAAEVNRSMREAKSWRKEQGLVLKEKEKPRRVLSEIGELHFQRDYYRDTKQNRYATPLDQILGIQKYERILASVGAELVAQATEVSYAKSAQIVTEGAVSRQTVRNQILKVKVPEQKPAFQKKQVKELHVFADEDHVHMQLPKKQRGKKNQIVPAVTVTEGIQAVSKHRNATICPMHFVDEDFDTKKLWETVGGYIEQAYDVEGLETLYVHADGGGWIKKGLEEFRQTVHVMDGFHFERELKRLANRFQGKNVRHRIHKAVEENDRKKADRVLQSLLEAAEEEGTTEKVKKFGVYLLSHWEEIRTRQNEGLPGSCTEGQISHLLSERFSRDPMGWSKKGLGKLSAARIYQKNGGRISSRSFREAKEEGQTYRAYAEQVLEESVKGATDWSVFDQSETMLFDQSSGTQQVMHLLGRTHSCLN